MNLAEIFKKNFIFIPVVASIVVGGFTSVKYVLNLTTTINASEQHIVNLDRDFGDSDPCEINVNCSEGANWQNQRDAAVRISFRDQGSFYWCSGTIMNNTAGGCTPYIISADHCAESSTSSDFGQSIFYLNYQSVDCNNPPGS